MKKIIGILMTVIILAIGATGFAEPSKEVLAEFENAVKEAEKVQQRGPADISLLDQAKLKLPPGINFIPQPQAARLMKAMGNSDNPTLVGLIVPEAENWFMAVKFIKEGYIKDDDAKNWKVDELLTSIKEGTESANKERKEKGFPELEIIGWVEKPNYNESKRQLIWSINAKHKGETNANAGNQTINYNTYALGREGFLSLTLITSMQEIGAHKVRASQLLSATEFVSGKRYEDFNSSTDKVAEYGLAALVAGAVAKKLGFWALLAGIIIKFGKFIAAAVFALVAAWAKFFRKKKGDAPPPPSTPPKC